MFMHSGDIMVMSGFSRLVNHAVPRVLPSPEGESLPGCLRTPLPADLPRDSVVDPCSVEDWQVCASYLKTARVNMTVRQVLAVGQDFPLEPMEENKRDIATEGSCHLDDDNSQVKRARLNPDCWDLESPFLYSDRFYGKWLCCFVLPSTLAPRQAENRDREKLIIDHTVALVLILKRKLINRFVREAFDIVQSWLGFGANARRSPRRSDFPQEPSQPCHHLWAR